MSGILLTPKYSLGQVVYYRFPDSPAGVILEIKYLVDAKNLEYLVGVGYGEAFWCSEREITDEKIY
jgi:hypothetical protein